MFSRLGPLFKTTFRQAESNDTRLAIPHDEREKGRRKEDEETNKETGQDPWEDSASVTVDALRAFLINFLKTVPGAEDEASLAGLKENETLSTRPPEQKRPTNTQNAKAVRAYQSMAEKTKKTTIPSSKKPASEKIEPTADLLQSQELRDIYQLIDDLEELEQKGLQILKIEKAETFIDGMKNAVRLEKSKL